VTHPRRLQTTRAFGWAVLALVLIILAVVAVSLVVGVAGFAPGSANFRLIVEGIRLPRALLALLIGGMLAVSGVYMQTLFQNPLAEPYITGVSAGAGLGAVIALGVLPLAFSHLNLLLPACAFAGGMAVTLLLFLLLRDAASSPLKLLLLGIALGTLAASLMAFILIAFPERMLRGALFWLFGSLAGASWWQVGIGTVVLVAGCAWGLLSFRALDALLLGREDAHNLGVNVPRLSRWLLVVATLLASVSVAFAGIVTFVGLVIPHIVRILFGAGHLKLIILSLLCGMALVGIVDLAARQLMPPGEIPLSIITSLIGAPFFILLLLKVRGGGYV